jgi:DNA-3-methyladenine glycosylase II
MRITVDGNLKQAADYLAKHDLVLAPIIKRAGLANLRPNKLYYQSLCDSIISQQLSVKAASTIERRFKELFGGTDFPPPEEILQKSVEELRTAGLSGAKANYIRDLAQHVVDGQIKFDHLDKLSNEEIVAELTDVKGIGEWTAHMFLMFCMGRLDILATGDLGIRNGVRALYNLKAVPTPEQIREIALKHHWHPYESVACWYIWHSLDNAPKI